MAENTSRAIETQYPRITSSRIIEDVARSVLISTYKDSPKLKKKAYEAYKKMFHSEISEGLFAKLDSSTLLLFGPPGNGKTSCVRAGCKKAAEAMGLNFTTPADLSREGKIPGDNDFLFIVHNLAGEISTLTFTGLPTKNTVDGLEYTGNIPYKMYAEAEYCIRKGGAAFVLFDDAGNAPPNILTAFYDIVHERSRNGQPMPACAIATNYGKEDGNVSTYIPAALLNRVHAHHYDMRGEEDNFIQFLEDRIDRYKKAGAHPTAISYLTAITAFFESNKNYIVPDPKFGKDIEAMPTPRSIEKMMHEVLVDGCTIFSKESDQLGNTVGHRSKGHDIMLSQLNKRVKGFCGNELSFALSAFVESYMDNVEPMIAKVFQGMSDAEYKEYQSVMSAKANRGVNAEGLRLAIQIGYSAADHAANHIDVQHGPEKLKQSFKEAFTLLAKCTAGITNPHTIAVAANRSFNMMSKKYGDELVKQGLSFVTYDPSRPEEKRYLFTKDSYMTLIHALKEGGIHPGEISAMRGELSGVASSASANASTDNMRPMMGQ